MTALEPAPRCWCCQSRMTTRGDCPICDWAGMMSPPHACLRTGRVISDECGIVDPQTGDPVGCPPDFAPLPPDHESVRPA